MIIVTGGAGFIGSNLVAGLNQAGADDILVVDNLTNAAKHLNLNSVRIADYMDKGDLLGSLASLPEIEAIFHQGACSSTTESDGRYMMKNNYEYSKALFHYAVEREIPFIYASSASVYGNGDDGFVEERRCEYPLNVYGFSKFAFDQYVRRHLPTVRSPVVGLRYFNVYGPQENHKGRMASVAFHLFHQQKRGEPMKLFEGSDTFKRDFVHVNDCVAVNLFFFEKGTTGIYNCGSGQARTFGDIARVLQTRLGGAVETIPFPADLAGKYQTFTEASLLRLRAAGYDAPFTTLEDGVGSYCEVLERTGGHLR